MAESSDPSWSEVDSLLSQALERPASERSAWLRETCKGNDALVAEVERLLRLSESEDAALQPSHLAAFFHDALDTLGGDSDDDREARTELKPGDRIGPYEILGLIGSGGMGCVYRARDVTLRREIAIKALAGSFSADSGGLRRFGREARLLASLNHPNIATIYDLLQFEGRPYLILELVEGETLAERLNRTGAIPIGESVRAARQLAEALEEAHEKGVIHRDLKPSNVKLTSGGRVKVLDFGLAKLQAVRSTASPPLSPSSATTRSGLVLGTPAYMSPEQARGQPVDRRTDIWSFGCLLYEMLTGERAFRGGSGFDVVASVLRDEVVWSRLPPYTPAAVRRLLRRCLEKDAGARPQSMAEVRAALDEAGPETIVSGPRFAAPAAASYRPVALIAGLAVVLALAAVASVRFYAEREEPAPAGRVVVAVLPFRSLDAEEADYLADGLTEDLISQLGRIHPARLGVIARHTAMTYKEGRKEIEEIGRELPVQYVVEGSVRRQGERLRVTAHLTRVGDLVTLWTASYDRTLGDVLALQAEVADEIARRIRVAVAPPTGLRAQPAAVAPEAYDAYLQGRYYQLRGTTTATEQAIQAFEQAIQIEPDFALAHAGLARSWVFGSRRPPAEALELARSTALHAVELEPAVPETRTALALARLYADWDWDGAIAEFEQALELDPGNAETHYYLSHALTAAGRLDAAVASARRALELDPFSPLIQHYIGRLRFYQRDYDAALVEYAKAVDLDPGYSWTELFLSLTYRQLGRYEESVRHQQRFWSLMRVPPDEVQALGAIFEAEGFEAVLRARIADVEERTREVGYVSSMELAISYAHLGENDRALDWLERAFSDHTRDLIYLAVEPGLDPLRQEPRFQTLMSRMGRAAEPRAPSRDGSQPITP